MRDPGRLWDGRVREGGSAARRLARHASLCAALAFASAVAGPAGADEATADEAARREAAARFAEGERAFGAGDFPHAAASFEAAWRAAPHPDALWNAARAHQRAGERARAANLYARYLRTAPPEARDRNGAATALRELAERLGRFDVVAPGGEDVRVDDEHVDGPSVYVHPGTHVVRARFGERVVQRAPSVDAGAVVSVALVDDPPPASPPAVEPARPAPSAPPPVPATARPRPAAPRPAVVATIVGGGLTALAGGVLLWSGVDTLDAKSAYDALPAGTRTQAVIDAGHAKQDRTNVLVGVTAGLAAVTAVGVVWLVTTDAKATTTSAAGARLGFGAGGATVAGRF